MRRTASRCCARTRVRLPRRRRLAHDRSHHDADRARRAVVFNDNKEGVIGMRVARGARAAVATAGGVRRRERQGDRRCRRWTTPASPASTRAARARRATRCGARAASWTMLHGTSDDEPVTLAMLDHPRNPGYPTYWHARGYGLFAANPLGQKIFSEGQEELEPHLEPGDSVDVPLPRRHPRAATRRPTASSGCIATFAGSRRMRVGIIGGGNISETHAARGAGDRGAHHRGGLRRQRGTRRGLAAEVGADGLRRSRLAS